MKWRRTLALLLGCLLGGCGDPPQMPRGVPAALPRTPRPFLQPCEASAAGEPAHVLAADAVRPPLLMAFFAERGLFVSADEGRHWEGLTPAGQCHLPVASFLTNASWPLGLCVQARGADNDFYQQIYCSQDGARTWRQLFAPLPYVDFATPPVLDPRRPGRLLAPVWSFGCNPHAADNPWAPPCESLVVSDDGGRTWQGVRGEQAFNVRVSVTREAEPRVWVRRSGERSAFLQVDGCDGSLSCTPRLRQGDPCARATLARLDVHPERGDLWLMNWGDDGVWATRDAAETCQPVAVPEDLLDGPYFGDADGAWGTLIGLSWPDDTGERRVLTSRDGGQTWSVAAAPLPEPDGSLVVDGRGHLLFTGSALYRSGDAGASWARLAEVPRP